MAGSNANELLIQDRLTDLVGRIGYFFNHLDQPMINQNFPTEPSILGDTRFTKRKIFSRDPSYVVYATKEWFVAGDLVPDFPLQWWDTGFEVFSRVVGRVIEPTSGPYNGRRITVEYREVSKHKFFLYKLV